MTDTEGPESPLAARPSTAVRPSTPVAVRSGLGLLLLAALGLLLWLDMAWERGFVFAAAGTAAVAVATDEFVRMAGRLGVALPRRALVLGAAGLFGLHWGASAYGPAFAGWYAAGAGLAVAAMMAFTERVLRVRIDGALQVVGASLLGLLYVPLLFAFLTSVRLGWGVAGVVAVVAVCKAGSSSAYFTGKYLGRRKLTPRLSPKKTVAGAVGQFAGATLMAVLLALSPAAVMTPAAALLYGALIAAVGVVGDLAASLLKRQSGIKDWGELLPGFGGMLDMLDDILFAAPASLLFLQACELLHWGV